MWPLPGRSHKSQGSSFWQALICFLLHRLKSILRVALGAHLVEFHILQSLSTEIYLSVPSPCTKETGTFVQATASWGYLFANSLLGDLGTRLVDFFVCSWQFIKLHSQLAIIATRCWSFCWQKWDRSPRSERQKIPNFGELSSTQKWGRKG